MLCCRGEGRLEVCSPLAQWIGTGKDFFLIGSEERSLPAKADKDSESKTLLQGLAISKMSNKGSFEWLVFHLLRPLDLNIDYINRNNRRCKDKEPENSNGATGKFSKKSKEVIKSDNVHAVVGGSNYKIFSELGAIYQPGGSSTANATAASDGANQTGSGSALTDDMSTEEKPDLGQDLRALEDLMVEPSSTTPPLARGTQAIVGSPNACAYRPLTWRRRHVILPTNHAGERARRSWPGRPAPGVNVWIIDTRKNHSMSVIYNFKIKRVISNILSWVC
ncbi:hypothetical protein Cni_G22679 [Canna indica]|uniref:Uncharacterized protein n=1 Tax=Canna indica TaxID=4628 RepID=A0AAQ3KS89_9LILI|nr:hypothetical protein Cni_G22679 [Canna indica]